MALFVGNQQKSILLIKNNFTPLTQMETLPFLLSTFPFFLCSQPKSATKKSLLPQTCQTKALGISPTKKQVKESLSKKNKLKRTLKKRKEKKNHISALARALSKRHECSYSQTRRQKPLGYSKSLDPKALIPIQSNMRQKLHTCNKSLSYTSLINFQITR